MTTPGILKSQEIKLKYVLLSKVEEMMRDIIEAFKDNAQTETWLSGKSRKAVELKVSTTDDVMDHSFS